MPSSSLLRFPQPWRQKLLQGVMTMGMGWLTWGVEPAVQAVDLSGCAVPSFAVAPAVSTGANPRSVVAADFNHDGVQDLAFANLDDGTVSICLGLGDGSFGEVVHFPAGPGVRGIATGDFNQDGHLDLAVSVTDLGQVALLQGDGKGLFSLPSFLNAGFHPFGILATDLDKDGHLDLVVADNGCPGCRIDGSVLVLMGLPGGGFKPAESYSNRGNPISVALAYLNSDDEPDLLVADVYKVVVLLGAGHGTFEPGDLYSALPRPVAVAAADFDGDGHTDFVVADDSSNALSVWKGNGEGGFSEVQVLPTEVLPVSVAVADLNGDGLWDIVTAAMGGNGLSVFSGRAEGGFDGPLRLPTGKSPGAVLVADINHDGRPDLLSADLAGDHLSIFLNNCPGAGTRLQSRWSQGVVTFEWLDPEGLGTLESSDALPGAEWAPLPLLPVIRNGTATITLPTEDPARFYRVRLR